ncbi:MAG: rhomboid family intramembrane serine protease [Bacteroidota bacterium]
MAGFLDDLRYNWQKPNSLLTRLILINVFVFVFVNIVFLLVPRMTFYAFFQNLAMPTNLLNGSDGAVGYIAPFIYKPWTFFTAFFTHEGFGHILYNMLALYWFGKLIRDFLGDRKLLALYFLGGIIGSLSMLILYNVIPIFSSEAYGIGYGASAAVFAIMVAAATKFPEYQFNLLFFGPVRIKYIVLVLVLLSLFRLKGDNVGGEVAHLSGTLMGFLYIKQLHRGLDLGKPILAVADFIVKLFQPRPKIKVTHRSGKRRAGNKTSSRKGSKFSGSSVDNPPQEEIDAILDKISQSGYDSLTKDEKQKLFNASNR